jgi:predicted phosphodiesterase
MRRIIKIILAVILIVTAYSLMPLIVFYLKKDPAPYTNAQAVNALKDNKGDYFAFIVMGDTHAGMPFNDSMSLKVIRHINREDRFRKIPIDFVLSPGDITFRGSARDYRSYNKLRSLIKWPVISTIGNHDDDHGIAFFKKYAGAAEFSFPDRSSYFIFLDNHAGDVIDEQFAWLEAELKKSQAYKKTFVVLHKAPFSPYQQSWYRPELSEWSYRFMKLCQEYKVDMVFSGHEHIFKEESFGGVRYIISGGGGMLLYLSESAGGFPHYIVVRVRGDYIDYEVRRVFPPFWTYIGYYMWKEIFYFLKGVVF